MSLRKSKAIIPMRQKRKRSFVMLRFQLNTDLFLYGCFCFTAAFPNHLLACNYLINHISPFMSSDPPNCT